MSTWELVVALWNRDTHGKQASGNAERMRLLASAMEACDVQFSRIKIQKGRQPVIGMFVAPEYYFAAAKSGMTNGQGGLNQRCISAQEKDTIVQHMLVLSKRYPKVVLIPGSVAWSKSIQRQEGEQFKRDPATNLPTRNLKGGTRVESLHRAFRASLQQGGSRGGILMTPLFDQRLRKWITQNDGVPLAGQNRFYQLRNWVMEDPDDRLMALFGTTDGMYRKTIDQVQAWDLVLSDTADRVMKNTAYVMLGGTIRFKYNKATDFHESLSDGALVFCPGHKAGFTTIEGITVGLEICLDHAAGQLSKTPLPVSGVPMLHVVTSASVSPTEAHKVVANDGYWIHASSTVPWAGVQHKTAMGVFQDVDPIDEKSVGGDPLQFYRIELPNMPDA